MELLWWALVAIPEVLLAFWGTRWLLHPDHRAERLAFFSGRCRRSPEKKPSTEVAVVRRPSPPPRRVRSERIIVEPTALGPLISGYTCTLCHTTAHLDRHSPNVPDDGLCTRCRSAEIARQAALRPYEHAVESGTRGVPINVTEIIRAVGGLDQ
ncbi:hypothetical protein SEA_PHRAPPUCCINO_114 [Mycobacterium phage Phrappuccino]|uniref:Uncharacterized protein n=1 Tax=Mycobacterium phage Phrappuccino TaxID=2591223 RepID=A0A514DDU3_9CAUD|nr:hypothetical protein KHQ87_gp114 [Mycobacterium phage Phrappuccino]QDH91789.1 hypothetical protein SEA_PHRAPPUCCINO_114 [Mycobacterium phage Phrappuccino]QIQ63231.1 hypothetical protein SEA_SETTECANDELA_114 [Mycobacterium phage Settecandela]